MEKKILVSSIFGLLMLGLAGPSKANNIIDSTYGTGSGSFENGTFVNNGADYMGLTPSSTAILGWTVGGPGNGVDWLSSNGFAANSGLHSIDLINTSAGSINTVIPTTLGKTYKLAFYAASVSTGNAFGVVSAGSLENQSFTSTLTPGPGFANQIYTLFSFLFTAKGSATTVSFMATPTGSSCTPDCYGPVIDSVSVSAVPVPAAIWLFGSVLGAFGIFKKRIV